MDKTINAIGNNWLGIVIIITILGTVAVKIIEALG